MSKQLREFALALMVVLLSLSAVIFYFHLKYVVVSIMLLFSIGFLVVIYYYIQNRVAKEYYENIINTSTNIIIETDGELIKSVNKRFFDYIPTKNLEEFKNQYQCICNTFFEGEGYLQKTMGDLAWIEHVYKNPDEYQKVKIFLNNQFYYFSVSASLSLRNEKNYVVIFSDITAQENYKNDLEILTVRDALTGIGNRRVFEQRLKEVIASSQRYHFPFSLIIFDIDFFKKVNDDYGHEVGDKVLIEYTAVIASSLREGDEFCRIGGEEFVIIVPHTTKDKAYILAQKLRKIVENHKHILPITMSFGVTQYISGDDNASIYKRADDALYKSKEGGRNKVMLG